jgi:hypothetical protein
MKNLYLILIGAMTLLSCKKEVRELPDEEEIQTARWQTRELFIHVSAKSTWGGFDSPMDNHKGAAYEVGVEELKMQGAYTKSCWIAIRGKTPEGRRVWAQWGWFNLDRGIEQAFQVWDLDSRSLIPVEIRNRASVPLEVGVYTRFEIINVEGTTWWQLKRNGLVVFEANLGFETASNFPSQISSNNVIEVATESRGGDSFSPELHVRYVEYYKDGVWNKVPHARASVSVQGARTEVNWWNVRPGSNLSEFYIGGRGQVEIASIIW